MGHLRTSARLLVGCAAIIVVSLLTEKPNDKMLEDFDAVNAAK